LADKNLNQAVNPLTGFAAECAASFWTTDSNAYWQSLGISPPPLGQCLDPAKTTSDWSDLPDGPFVEKGGIAQVTRVRQPSTRKLMTVVSGTSDSLVDVTAGSAVETSTAAAMGSPEVLRYLRGGTPGVDETLGATPGRPSIHGDVIHSRPLTITYGGSGGIYVFYGANDGLFRAVNAADGSEAWSLVAPEHFSGIKRLYDNSPTVAFPNSSPTVSPTPQKKGYFFDGSIGQVVRVNASNEVELAYIYPTMRRGGRMVYALDVTTPTSPRLLWRQGCPNLANDTGCSVGFSGIGQTWSTPKSGYPKGYTDVGGEAQPILIFGGGYDTCLDTDSAAYPTAGCAAAKGLGIYVLDATTGAVLRGPTDLPTDAPVVAELSTLDIDFDGYVDYAYAADAKGNLYRIDFSSLTSDNLSSLTPLDVADWSIKKIATTSNPEHRFLNQPVVGSFNAVVYVALGSGNRERPLEINYPYAEDVDDRFYAFIDFPYDSSVTPIDLNGSDLVDVTYDPASPPPAEECNPQGNRGWYTRLTGQGEQVVNPAAIAGGKVFFNSYQPGGASVGGLCSRPLGIGTGYQFSLFNPTRCENPATRIVGPGMPIPPIITTVKIPDTDCDGPDCKPVTVTLCIGCEGFEPVEIEPVTDPIRAKVYWNSDIDR
jgi:type IV pilus assembly protein PilY1